MVFFSAFFIRTNFFLSLPEYYVALMNLLDHLYADVQPFCGFCNGCMIELHRCHGLVEVFVGPVDVDPFTFGEVVFKVDSRYPNLRVIVRYLTNYGLHRLLPPA
jgi:hypothetical protein